MELMQLVSIGLELVVAVIAVLVGMRGATYAYGFALTYALYVFYDLSKLYDWPIPSGPISTLFFVATLGALWGMWGLYHATARK
jgi:hypothetical protein